MFITNDLMFHITKFFLNEDDAEDEMKHLQSVSNLENPFNQRFHLDQALQTVQYPAPSMKYYPFIQ